MPISDCCKLEVVCCYANASVPEVAALMREHDVGDVIVIGSQEQERVPLGIVTDRDIVVEAVAPNVDLNLLTAGDIMSTPLATVRDSAGFWESLQTMRELKIRRMPVVRHDGTLYGIVTADDILGILATELAAITGTISGELSMETPGPLR